MTGLAAIFASAFRGLDQLLHKPGRLLLCSSGPDSVHKEFVELSRLGSLEIGLIDRNPPTRVETRYVFGDSGDVVGLGQALAARLDGSRPENVEGCESVLQSAFKVLEMQQTSRPNGSELKYLEDEIQFGDFGLALTL